MRWLKRQINMKLKEKRQIASDSGQKREMIKEYKRKRANFL
jgi:hypothetical protein